MAEFEKMDEVFRERIGDGETGVPASSWQSIQNKMAAQAAAQKKEKRIWMLPIPLLWIAAGFLAGTMLTGTGFYVYELQKENKELRQLVDQYSKDKKQLSNPIAQQYASEKPTETPNYASSGTSDVQALTTPLDDRFLEEDKNGMKGHGSIYSYSSSSRSYEPKSKGSMTQGGVFSETYRYSTVERAKSIDANFGTNNSAFDESTLSKPSMSDSKSSELKTGKKQKDSVLVKPADSLSVKEKEAKETAKPKEKKAPKLFGLPIAVGMYLSPEVASRSIHFTGEEDPELVKYKQNDKAKFGFSAGLSLDLELPKNFYLRAGLNYWNLGDRNSTVMSNSRFDTSYTVETYKITGDGRIDTAGPASTLIPDPADKSKILSVTSTEITESFSKLSKTVSNNYHYIGIPILIGMKLSRSKVSAGVYSGFMTNFLVSPNKSVYYIYYDPENPEKYREAERELSRVTLAYWGGIDVDVRLSDKWSVNVSPSVKYSLTSLYKDSDAFKQFPYSFGLQVGCKYRFGK